MIPRRTPVLPTALLDMLVPRGLYSIFVADGRLTVAGGDTGSIPGSGLTETVDWTRRSGNGIWHKGTFLMLEVPWRVSRFL